MGVFVFLKTCFKSAVRKNIGRPIFFTFLTHWLTLSKRASTPSSHGGFLYEMGRHPNHQLAPIP